MSGSVFMCAGSLCCCLVVCSVIRILVPAGNTTRIMSVVVSVFLLCCMLSLFFDIFKNADFVFDEDELEFNEDVVLETRDDFVLKEAADYLNGYILTLLNTEGIESSSVKTILADDADRGIYVKEINIYLNEYNDNVSQNIKKLVFDSVGVKPQILESEYE